MQMFNAYEWLSLKELTEKTVKSSDDTWIDPKMHVC